MAPIKKAVRGSSRPIFKSDGWFHHPLVYLRFNDFTFWCLHNQEKSDITDGLFESANLARYRLGIDFASPLYIISCGLLVFGTGFAY
jgi:hypothetical protein